jgi:hypothetical protein
VALAHAGSPRVDDDMCATPKLDTAKWLSLNVPAGSIKLPKGYSQAELGSYYRNYRGSGRVAGVLWSEAGFLIPDSLYVAASRLAPGQHGGGPGSLGNTLGRGGAHIDGTLISLCQTVIGDRPVEITTYSWNYEDAPRTMSANAGKHYLATARWAAADRMPVLYVWYASDYRSDMMQMRQIFWTAHFIAPTSDQEAGVAEAVPYTAPCADSQPPPRGTVAEFLDTSVVGMLANGASPRLPKGSGTVLLRFDSTGNVAGVSVGASLMADAAQKELGAIVGSNVIAQKPGSVTHVRIKVTVGDSALSYALVGVGNCKR